MYHFTVNEKNINATVPLFQRQELMNQPTVESNEATEMILATYSDQKITTKNILDHIYSFPKQYAAVKTDELLIKKAFDFYSLRKLKETYNNNLESNFPEFAHNLNEFKEGLVLFELLEQNIWNESATDTVALQNYYQNNKTTYLQPANFIGEVYVFNSKSDAKTYHKLLKKNYKVKEADFQMVYKYQGRFYMNDKRLPENLDFNSLGKNVVKHNNNYYVFYIRDKKDEHQSNYEEVKNQVLSDYQKQYEDKYNQDLINKVQIKVNQPVLDQLKTKYNKKTLN